jgi:hypothetical protein
LEITVAAILLAARRDQGAVEPEVSESERRLHGDLAGVVQLMRRASHEARTAHLLACQRRREHQMIEGDEINRIRLEALDQAVEETWKAQMTTWIAFRDVANVPPQLFL